jgi:pilus assembly protein CpaE
VTVAALKSRFAVLERVPTLFGLDANQLRFLARRARPTFAASGSPIVSQGETGDAMYVLVSGRCEVSVSEAPGSQATVALLGPFEAFGEEAVVLDETRQATVRAVEDTDLLVIDREAIASVLSSDSEQLADLRRLVEQRKTSARLLTGWATGANLANGAGTSSSLAVYSPKGGAGRTTIALNLAAQLARFRPGEVAVLDLSLPFNNAALMSSLVPVNSLAQLATAPGSQFEEAVLSAILPHSGGFTVLPAVIRPEQAELLTPQLVERAVDVLKRSFRHLVVDLSPQLSDVTLSVLERADRVLLLVTPELAALKDVTELQRIFRELLRVAPSHLLIALNHRAPKGAIGRAEIERHLGSKLLCEFHFEGAKLDEAGIRGEILSVAEPKGAMARAAGVVLEALGVTKNGESKPGRRLFGRG